MAFFLLDVFLPFLHARGDGRTPFLLGPRSCEVRFFAYGRGWVEAASARLHRIWQRLGVPFGLRTRSVEPRRVVTAVDFASKKKTRTHIHGSETDLSIPHTACVILGFVHKRTSESSFQHGAEAVLLIQLILYRYSTESRALFFESFMSSKESFQAAGGKKHCRSVPRRV